MCVSPGEIMSSGLLAVNEARLVWRMFVYR